MSDFTETQALAILFSNTKRKKRDENLLMLAKSTQFLIDLYKDVSKVSEIATISENMIRQLVLPLELPLEVQQLIEKREIDSIDVVRSIHSLKNPDLQIEAAKLLTGLPSKEVRDIINLFKTSRLDLKQSYDIIQEFKIEDLHILLIDIEEEYYNILSTISNKYKMSPGLITKAVIYNWLNSVKNKVI